MARPRIAFLITTLADMGGAIKVATEVANALVEEYDVSFIQLADKGAPAFAVDPRIACLSLGIDAERIVDKAKALLGPLRRVIREQGIQVLLGVSADEVSAALLPCKLTRTPLVFCDHESLMSQIDLKKTMLVKRTLARQCARTVVLTEASRQAYIREFQIRPDKLLRIPNWIPDRLEERASSWDPASKRVIWAGRLDVEKGVDHLFEVARRVLPGRPDWAIDVYGRAVLGTSDFDLAAAAEEAGIGAQLVLKGQVHDLYERYPSYGVGILTSYRESLPLFLLEAKACGLPLVSFDVVTGPSEIISDGVNGYLIPPYDCDAFAAKLGALMDDDDLRQEFHEAAPQGLGQYSKAAIYPQWTALIRALL